MKIRRNDQVKVMAGKDKGKTGKVLYVFSQNCKAIVEGINFVKKHMRRTKQDQQGGIIQKEAPISISNLQLICPRCSKSTRVGFDILSDGKKARYCKKCDETL